LLTLCLRFGALFPPLKKGVGGFHPSPHWGEGGDEGDFIFPSLEKRGKGRF